MQESYAAVRRRSTQASSKRAPMLVLIDESGDPGFKMARGSSPYFVVAMVIFDDLGEAELTGKAIAVLRNKLRLKTEFKFFKSHDDVKDAFFECVCARRFSVRAIVVDKSAIYSENLRDRKDLFYNYFVKMLLRHDRGALQKARIKIDGSGDRSFRNELNTYLRRECDTSQITGIRFANSCNDTLIQLADMVAGAILRSCRDDRKDSRRWRKMLERAGRIDNIWPFR